MPVEAPDLEAAAERYAADLEEIAGSPPVLDLVHLGLGPDGHTASLVPGDPVLDVTDADVALTGVYQGRRRMTLTYPILNRARRVLWVVTGSDKAGPLAKLLKGDVSIPAGRVRQDRALLILADRAAAGPLEIPSMRSMTRCASVNSDRSRRLRLDAGTYHVYAVYGDGGLMEGSLRIRGIRIPSGAHRRDGERVVGEAVRR